MSASTVKTSMGVTILLSLLFFEMVAKVVQNASSPRADVAFG
jgi:hypothetical protein